MTVPQVSEVVNGDGENCNWIGIRLWGGNRSPALVGCFCGGEGVLKSEMV